MSEWDPLHVLYEEQNDLFTESKKKKKKKNPSKDNFTPHNKPNWILSISFEMERILLGICQFL
jgi:hypothetical protein